MKLLVIEDDVEIASGIVRMLSEEGFTVEWAPDGKQGHASALASRPSLVILDVMLPIMDGYTVAKRLRADGFDSPILMLTAKDTVDDRVQGLEGGADDYLVKPFHNRELLARIRALLRRDKTVRTGSIEIGDMEIDTVGHRVVRGGREITLTPREYALLEALARNAGRTLTREVILERVWDSEENTEGTVNYHVSALRKKIDEGFAVKLIHTVHGFGYALRTPEAGK